MTDPMPCSPYLDRPLRSREEALAEINAVAVPQVYTNYYQHGDSFVQDEEFKELDDAARSAAAESETRGWKYAWTLCPLRDGKGYRAADLLDHGKELRWEDEAAAEREMEHAARYTPHDHSTYWGKP